MVSEVCVILAPAAKPPAYIFRAQLAQKTACRHVRSSNGETLLYWSAIHWDRTNSAAKEVIDYLYGVPHHLYRLTAHRLDRSAFEMAGTYQPRQFEVSLQHLASGVEEAAYLEDAHG